MRNANGARGTRNVKVVCTLGPATSDVGTVRALADAGMAVARLNASHGDPESLRAHAERVRAVDDATDRPLALLVDLQGPEVRTAARDEPLQVATGDRLQFVPGAGDSGEGGADGSDADGNGAAGGVDGDAVVGVSHSLAAAAPGDRVLVDDGRVETEVVDVDGDRVAVRVTGGGEIASRKGINVPGVDLGLPAVTGKDERDLAVAAEVGADFVAASFVRDGADVLAVSEVLEDHGADVPVVAKVERRDAVENLDGILDAAYGVMVARGDLGVECPLEDVPLIQKRIVRECRAAGVPVITATEMLDSMVHAPRPTRAEASDVANAVLDGTDAVMLSAETAVGDHPVRVVETMDRILRGTEGSAEYADHEADRVPPADGTSTDALARSGRYLARDVGASAVVAVSESGYTARKTSKFHPPVPVVAATPDDRVRRRLALSWGVRPRYVDLGESRSLDDALAAAVDAALGSGAAESGDTVVVLAGMLGGPAGPDTTNTLKVHVAAATLARGRTVVAGRAVGPAARTTDGDLTALPDGAVLVLPESFDGEFTGDVDRLAGVVSETAGLTSYAAMVARELDVPMVSGATTAVPDGTTVTLDAERGVLYEGDVQTGDDPEPSA